MTASRLCLTTAPLIAICGMIAGVVMAASKDHTIAPAHAHLNLLGFAGTLLMGLVYRLDRAIDQSRLAMVQVVIWLASVVIMFPSLAYLLYGHPEGEIGASATSMAAILSMILFAWNAWRIAGTDGR